MADKKKTEQSPRKKAYQEPMLTRYGRLKDLTTGGTGHSHEPSSGKRPRP
jgi:hypothetical protein